MIAAIRIRSTPATSRRPKIATTTRDETISGIDSPEQQSAVRRAGADMGTGAALGAVTELPLLHLPRDHAALEAVQRLTVARRVRSASEWANAG